MWYLLLQRCETVKGRYWIGLSYDYNRQQYVWSSDANVFNGYQILRRPVSSNIYLPFAQLTIIAHHAITDGRV